MVAAAMLGLPSLVEWVRSRSWARWGAFAVSLAAVYSFAVNLTGSLVGTMFCEIQQFAFPVYLRMPLGAQLDSYPLAIPCLSLLMVLASAGMARLLVAPR
jgi:predicted membrane protein